MIALLIASLLSVPAHADFNASVATLKAKAVAKFLADANNPASAVGQLIAKENADNTDGRNPDGIIKLPLKAADLQVTMLSAEDMLNPWHYGQYENGKCLAGGNSAKFLIAVTERTGVHAAGEISTMLFQVATGESYSFAVKTQPESCQEEVGSAKITKALNVEEFKQVKIAE